MRTTTILEGIKKARESKRPDHSHEENETPLGENPLEGLYLATVGTHQENWWELPEEKKRRVLTGFANQDPAFCAWCAMHDQQQETVTGREEQGQLKITRFFWSKIHKQNGD